MPSPTTLGSNKKNGMTYRRHLMLEQIARLTAMGLDDTQISMALGIHKGYVSMQRRTPQYIAVWAEVQTGVVGTMDQEIRLDTQSMISEMRDLVPTALLALRDAIYDKSQPRIRYEAAKQILDREGSLAIVSKSEVKKTIDFDFSENDKHIPDLLAALQSVSNKEELPGAAAFKQASLNKEQQREMYEQIDIRDFDLKSDRPQ